MQRGQSLGAAWSRVDPAFEPLRQALALAEASGAAIGPMLIAAAAQERRAAARKARLAARQLGVKMALPLGLAILPSFICLGVIPVILGFAQSIMIG